MRRLLFIYVFCVTVLPLYANTLIIPDAELPKHVEVQTVLVSGTGHTSGEAFNNALAVAVERVAGMLLTSETYVKNGELIYEQIVRVAPSYVVSYKPLFENETTSGYRVTIEAQVAKRKLADKLNSLNVAILEVADTEQAHAQLLASISDYSNTIETIRRAFRRTFGNINGLFTITIRDVHFYTADVKEGKVPVSVVFNVAIDQKKYEERRAAIARVLVENIGAVETKAVTPYTFLVDNETLHKKFNWKSWSYDLRKDYRLMLMRKQGDGYVFDAYDMLNLPEDMRDFAYIDGVNGRQLIDGIWDDHVHVTFKNNAGDVVFEDFVIMMTKEFIHAGVRDIPQTNLSIMWDSSISLYNRTFQLDEYGDDLNSMLTCAMIYNDDGYCVVFERQSSASPGDTKLIMPFFSFNLEEETSFIEKRIFSDNLTFEYMAYIPLEQVDAITEVLVETVDIPLGDEK